MQTLAPDLKSTVATSLAQAPIIAVVRHQDRAVATGQALAFMRHGLEMIEVTFTVPGATELVRELLALRPAGSAIRIGMGTVTTAARACSSPVSRRVAASYSNATLVPFGFVTLDTRSSCVT